MAIGDYKTKLKPLRVGAAAVYPYSQALQKQFTFKSKYGDIVKMHRLCADEIWIPRGAAPKFNDQRELGLPVSFHNYFVPRNSEQTRVVNESVELLQNDVDHILSAPTGFGKTYLGCAIAAHIQRRTLVITTKEDIIEQWAKAAKEVLGVKSALWRGDKYPLPNAPFVIGLVQSIMKGPERYPPATYKGFGLVICDEVHRMGADEFSQAMWWLPARHRLGLSATPYRQDGKTCVFNAHIGHVLVETEMETMIPKILVVNTGWMVPKTMVKGVVKRIPHSPGKTAHINKILGNNLTRNQIIIDLLLSCQRKKRTIIVFADTINHLKTLRDLLLGEKVPESDIGFYVGLQAYEGKKAERLAEREAAKYKPIILATYAMASEATNIPWLDAAILATPRANVIQIVGRIRREAEDKKPPVVFDLADRDSKIFRMYEEKRRRWYMKLGAEVVDL